ncbi:flagellar basal body-associated FliL family protein [Herminiimonas sp.]|uniref:flagellar basal body-associated FliL family protein n=1 Tax=Herminiimonas sp. TaxID=1926289 RepID=UPI0027269809|nr:flagellar basal body-associated FliL family protein [Herminiimonas sp.]MDO8306042.1 flagellar basal body-associated FliL family protein [Herminiimonas sp.]
MAKAKQTEMNAAIIGATLALVVIAILAVWFFLSYRALPVASSSYTSFGPVVVRSSQFSVKTSYAVQTRNDDEEWVKSHQKELNFAVQAALANADPQRLRDPDSVTYLQEMLRDAANTALNTRNVEAILLTDLIVQAP